MYFRYLSLVFTIFAIKENKENEQEELKFFIFNFKTKKEKGW